MFLVPDTAIPGGERVKLLDFGIAKFLSHSMSQTTAMDIVMGTPRYMAPEQCEGRDKVDSKVDVYSLGIIFYELLAGQRPFDAQTSNAIMRQHLNMKPPPLRERAPGVGESLCRLVHEMLAKEGAKRPSMAQVQERLADSARSAAAGRRRYLLVALAMGVLAAGWFGWHHGKRQMMQAGATGPTAGVSAGATGPTAGVAAGATTPTGARPGAAAAEPAGAAPASAVASAPGSAPSPGAGTASVPAASAAATVAAAPPAVAAPETAAGGRGGAGAAASRVSRRRASRETGRHEPPAASPPGGGGVLKAIDFGKH